MPELDVEELERYKEMLRREIKKELSPLRMHRDYLQDILNDIIKVLEEGDLDLSKKLLHRAKATTSYLFGALYSLEGCIISLKITEEQLKRIKEGEHEED